MTNSPYIRAALAQATLELAPPMIRETLLSEPEFREQYGVTADAVLTLGDSSISFQRSIFFGALRKAFSDTSKIELADTEGREWRVSCENDKDGLSILTISRDEQRLNLSDFAALSPDSSLRLHSLGEAASDANLPAGAREVWRAVVSERALKDDEINEYWNDFRDTPAQVARSIHSKLVNRQVSISTLVPSSRRYFERLIGTHEGSTSIWDYAVRRGRHFFEELTEWRPYEGFLFSLLLSSHSALTDEINVGRLKTEDLITGLSFLENRGDRISQLGAIEVSLRVLPKRPEIEPALIRLIKKIRDDEIDEPTNGFRLISTLFLLVDGELSRLRLFASEPPFYRRLAAVTQAALIGRQLLATKTNTDHFLKWAFETRVGQFYFQSYADMRMEPRWNPHLAISEYIRADFFRRVILTAKRYEKHIKGRELADLVLNNTSISLVSLCEYPTSYLPGPLEGAEDSPNSSRPDIPKEIEAQLKKEKVDASSFVGLVNAALTFRVSSSQAELAAKTLKIANHRLPDIENRDQLLGILNGLATVAAVTRSRSLADELRVLVRRYRYDIEYTLTIREALQLCLTAAASRAVLNDWREFVGDWLTELAFSDFAPDEGEAFHSHLKYLMHAVPELWLTCGRAEAALSAYSSR